MTLAFSPLIGIGTFGPLSTHVYASRNRDRSNGQLGSYRHYPPILVPEPSTHLLSLSRLTFYLLSLYHSPARAPFNSRYILRQYPPRPMTMSTHLLSNLSVRRSGTSRLRVLYRKLSTTSGCEYQLLFFFFELVAEYFLLGLCGNRTCT